MNNSLHQPQMSAAPAHLVHREFSAIDVLVVICENAATAHVAIHRRAIARLGRTCTRLAAITQPYLRRLQAALHGPVVKRAVRQFWRGLRRGRGGIAGLPNRVGYARFEDTSRAFAILHSCSAAATPHGPAVLLLVGVVALYAERTEATAIIEGLGTDVTASASTFEASPALTRALALDDTPYMAEFPFGLSDNPLPSDLLNEMSLSVVPPAPMLMLRVAVIPPDRTPAAFTTNRRWNGRSFTGEPAVLQIA